MSISQNFPDIRPTLNLDFANTKTLDPRITYTRASTGTYYGVDGVLKTASANQARFDHDPVTGESLGLLVEEARTNLLTRSEHLVDSDWQKSNGTIIPESDIAPNGTITSDKFIRNSAATWAYVQRSFSVNAGVTYTISVFVKGSGVVRLRTDGNMGGGSGSAFEVNLTTGSISLTNSAYSNYFATQHNNGWWRVSFTRVSSADGLGYLALDLYNSFSNDNVLIWGAQAEAGSFFTSYIPTPATFTSRSTTATYYDANGTIQTAGINVARSNAYFPDENGVFKPAGLLLEAAGTNRVWPSETIVLNSGGGQTWTNDGTSISFTNNAGTSPAGTNTATKLFKNNGASYGYLRCSFGSNFAMGDTLSIYFKAAELSSVDVQFTSIGNTNIDLATKTASRGSLQKLSNGWYRWSYYAAANPGDARIYPGGTTYVGDGVSGVLIWGAQIEASPYPTSYIPTTTASVTRAADVSSSSTVTRSADVAQITGTNFSSWYNQSEGTLLTSIAASTVSNSCAWTISDGSANNRITSFTDNSSYSFYVVTGGSIQAQQAAGGYTKGARISAAGTYATNNFNYARSGTTLTADTLGTVPVVNQLRIMAGATGGNIETGTISRLTYYPVRLSDSQLQNLTK